MKAPQVVMIALITVEVTAAICRHGEPLTGAHDAWNTMAGMAILAVVLQWGRFWK